MDDGLLWDDSWGEDSLCRALGGMGTGKDGKRRKAAGRAQEINRRPGSAREESEAAGRGAWKVLKDGLDQGRVGLVG